MKFFLFTQLSGLLMLIAILALYFMHHQVTGLYTFDYSELLGTPLSRRRAMDHAGIFGCVRGEVAGRTVSQLAAGCPFGGLHGREHHPGRTSSENWRVRIPEICPAAVSERCTGVRSGCSRARQVGILYGAIMAFAQTDLKRLVAYTSVSHLGFVLLGIFSWNPLAFQGAVMTMICHGFSTGALFVLAGGLQERMHTRDMARMGGLWSVAPRLSGAALFFALASLGLPGIGDFVGEVLVLLGAYRVSIGVTVAAAIGVLAATFYALTMVQRVFQGANIQHWRIPDLNPREGLMAGAMIAALLWLGLYPQPVLNTFQPAMVFLQRDSQTALSR